MDPWGLPSGSATLRLATQDSIIFGAPVQAFDFSSGNVESLLTYSEIVAAGVADLVFVELESGEAEHWLRTPEDPLHQLDRHLLAGLGPVALEDVTDMLDPEGEPLPLVRFVLAAPGEAYVMLQIDNAAQPETTAVKLAVTALSDSTMSFDWVWQPNGEREFVPTSTETRSFSAVKSLY
jgi:hypothetical protein